MPQDPIRPTDDEARALARQLVADARHGALGWLDGADPVVTRIALAPVDDAILTLVSDLAPHTAALRTGRTVSLLVGEPGRGDPLAHPRLSLQLRPEFIDKKDGARAYLERQPKARLYIGFGDFHMVRLIPLSGALNAGFGKAYRLGPEDLA